MGAHKRRGLVASLPSARTEQLYIPKSAKSADLHFRQSCVRDCQPLNFAGLPFTSLSHPLSPTHESNVHQPGVETVPYRWQRCILPLDHWCLWKMFGRDSHVDSASPCTTLPSVSAKVVQSWLLDCRPCFFEPCRCTGHDRTEGDHLTAIATKANIAPTTYAFTCFFPDSEAIGVLISNLD